MRGRVHVEDREDGKPGCTFAVDLPGRVDAQPAITPPSEAVTIGTE